MIICMCKAITERRLRAAVQRADDEPVDVQRRCGAGTSCGACRAEVERIVLQERRRVDPLAAK